MINIVIVGVGGQGTLLASKVLGGMAVCKGLDVKLSEVHGMAQRGGSVITHVRMGEKVFAPLVSEREADFVLAFEHLEALRAEAFVKEGGVLIANTQRIMPMPVLTGQCAYPDTPLRARHVEVDAYALALQAGDSRSVNVVLLGVLSRFLPWAEQDWLDAIEKVVPPKTLSVNDKAFRLGRRMAQDAAVNA